MQVLDTQTVEMGLSTTTMNEKKEESTPNWFEQAIDDYDYESPKRGQFIEGVILRIDQDAILVDIGVKRDAIVPSWDINMLPKDYLADLSIGSEVLVCVMRPPEGDQDLLVSLNKGLEYKSWEHAEAYLENGLTFEVEIIGENRGGLLANFEGLRAFIPNSQVAELRRRDNQRARQLKNELIGQDILVKVIEVDRDRQRLILSALAAEDEKRKKRLEELEERQIILGKVSSTVKFGIFVDLGGIDGLVHISELDWQRVDRPSDLFKVGDEIQVQVIGIDIEHERVSLSRKALLPSPWQQIEQKLSSGDVIEGEVKNVLDFGAFVEVAEGIEGLVHVSEIGYSATGAPQDLVKPGEKILVRVLEIDPDRERISLSMRRVPIEEQIAWMTENEVQEAKTPSTKAEKPKGETAEAAVPEAAASEVVTPESEAEPPKDETAEATAPESAIPEVASPEAEAEPPKDETAEATALESAIPEVASPEAEAEPPKDETAEAAAPEANVPEETTPEAETPETETELSKDVKVEAAIPEVETPETEKPESEIAVADNTIIEQAEIDASESGEEIVSAAPEEKPATEAETALEETAQVESVIEEASIEEDPEKPAQTTEQANKK